MRPFLHRAKKPPIQLFEKSPYCFHVLSRTEYTPITDLNIGCGFGRTIFGPTDRISTLSLLRHELRGSGYPVTRGADSRKGRSILQVRPLGSCGTVEAPARSDKVKSSPDSPLKSSVDCGSEKQPTQPTGFLLGGWEKHIPAVSKNAIRYRVRMVVRLSSIMASRIPGEIMITGSIADAWWRHLQEIRDHVTAY